MIRYTARLNGETLGDYKRPAEMKPIDLFEFIIDELYGPGFIAADDGDGDVLKLVWYTYGGQQSESVIVRKPKT